MKKYSIFFILAFLIMAGQTYGQTKNIFFGITIRSEENPRYSQDIRFINPSKPILPEIIKRFGKNYSNQGDTYIWEDVKVKGLSWSRLNIKIEHIRYDFKEPYQGIVVDEKFIVSITKKNRDFLHELKFWNVCRLRKIFKKYSEPLVYE
jgi:hypothetical protein